MEFSLGFINKIKPRHQFYFIKYQNLSSYLLYYKLYFKKNYNLYQYVIDTTII